MLVWRGYAQHYKSLLEVRVQNVFPSEGLSNIHSYHVEETYDAYERDIAIVSFYFKEATVFEYTRLIWNSTI